MLAGNDLLLMPPDLAQAQQGLLDALGTGRLPRERLIEAVTRILTLKLALGGYPRPDIVHRWTHRRTGPRPPPWPAAAVTVLRGPCSGPLVAGPVRVTAARRPRASRPQWLTEALQPARRDRW